MKRMISTVLLPPRPTELGKIKIGGKGDLKKSRGGKDFRLPVRYDHFVVTTRTRGEDDNFDRDAEIHAELGDEPTVLDVRLMFDTPEENFFSRMVQYSGRSKIWECDGEEALNVKTGTVGKCSRDGSKGCKCKPYARLPLILEAAPTFGGFHTFRTTSWESTNNLQTSLVMFHEQFGSLRGLPLRLVLYPATDTYEENGQTKESTSHKVGLVLRVGFEEAAELAIAYHQRAQLARAQVRQLAAGVDEEVQAVDSDEEADIGEEYFPPDEAIEVDDLNAALEEVEAVDVPTDVEVAQLRELMDTAGLDYEAAADCELMIQEDEGARVRAKILELQRAVIAAAPPAELPLEGEAP